MINFINANSGIWNFLLTVATLFYVILTFNLLKENIKARRLQNQPNIIVDFEIIRYKGSLQLVVKNIGNSPALDIKIDIDPLIENPFENINFLAPNREISHTIKYFSILDPYPDEITKYNFNISFKDSYKKKYNNEYRVDISTLLNSLASNSNENILVDLVYYLKDIKAKMK